MAQNLGLILHPTLSRRYSSSKNWFIPVDPKYIRVEEIGDFSLQELAAAVDKIYYEVYQDRGYTISLGLLLNIKRLIEADEYYLSPLMVNIVNDKHELRELLIDNLMEYSDVGVIMPNTDSKQFVVVAPSKIEDVIVLQALSLILLRFHEGCLPRQFSQLRDLLSSFYESLNLIGRAKRIYKINLEGSKRTIPIDIVREKIMNLVGDCSVYKLMESFFNLPVIQLNDRKGKMSSSGIPGVGELTEVLFHLTLKYTLDPEFDIRFPGIQYRRFQYEAYIFIEEKVIFEEKAVLQLLEELSLVGEMTSIGPGDEALPCCSNKLIYLDNDCQVKISSYEDYDAIRPAGFLPK